MPFVQWSPSLLAAQSIVEAQSSKLRLRGTSQPLAVAGALSTLPPDLKSQDAALVVRLVALVVEYRQKPQLPWISQAICSESYPSELVRQERSEPRISADFLSLLSISHFPK